MCDVRTGCTVNFVRAMTNVKGNKIFPKTYRDWEYIHNINTNLRVGKRISY